MKVLSVGRDGESGFKELHWTYRCADELSAHEGRLTPDGVKKKAQYYQVKPDRVNVVRRKLRLLGLWDEAKVGLGTTYTLKTP